MAIDFGRSRIEQVRGMMEAVAEPVKALFNPFDWVPKFVERKRWVLPVVLSSLAGAWAGFSFGARWNAQPTTITALEQRGELNNLSEQELSDKIRTTQRIALVAGVLRGLVLLPLSVFGLALVLKVLGWFFHFKTPFKRCLSASSIALLPAALFYAIYALCALKAPSLSEADALTLVPSSLSFLSPNPRVSTVLRAIDFFNFWSLGILALSISAISGMSKRKSLLIALGLYALYVGVFWVGLPGMIGGRS
jgi:hypothetical protein